MRSLARTVHLKQIDRGHQSQSFLRQRTIPKLDNVYKRIAKKTILIQHTMAEVRDAKDNDLKGIAACILSSGLFTADEIGAVPEMFKHRDSKQIWLVAECDNTIVGVSYAGSLELTDRSWNLWMLGVHEEYQRMGIGSRLVNHVEERLKSERQRMLIIDTTQKEDQAGARALYSKLGYDQVARIPDFYEDGTEKLTFIKRLS